MEPQYNRRANQVVFDVDFDAVKQQQEQFGS